MIIGVEFATDKNQRELIPQLTNEYACVCQYSDFAATWGHVIDWHWHPAFEFNYMYDGEGVYRTLDQEVVVRKGDAIFVNSNAMHYIKSSDDDCLKQCTLKFNREFISGAEGTLLDNKYLKPIIACEAIQSVLIRPDTEHGVRMISRLLEVINLCREEPAGYEALMQCETWKLWLDLFEMTGDVRESTAGLAIPEHGNMKQMLEYVQEHYGERIQVADIAEAGAVSVRECTRCFSRYLKLPPNDYLNYYRLQVAAKRLRQDDAPIADISEDCGFSTVSYFGRMFKTEFGCTPREYRRAAG